MWMIPPEIWWPKKHENFGAMSHKFRELIANISGMQQDVVNRKTALQTTDIPAQARLIQCTLIRKRRKIPPAFWPTQRAAIRLGMPRI